MGVTVVPVTRRQLWSPGGGVVGAPQSSPPPWMAGGGSPGVQAVLRAHCAFCHPRRAVMRSHRCHPHVGSGMSHFGPSRLRWQ